MSVMSETMDNKSRMRVADGRCLVAAKQHDDTNHDGTRLPPEMEMQPWR